MVRPGWIHICDQLVSQRANIFPTKSVQGKASAQWVNNTVPTCRDSEELIKRVSEFIQLGEWGT